MACTDQKPSGPTRLGPLLKHTVAEPPLFALTTRGSKHNEFYAVVLMLTCPVSDSLPTNKGTRRGII